MDANQADSLSASDLDPGSGPRVRIRIADPACAEACERAIGPHVQRVSEELAGTRQCPPHVLVTDDPAVAASAARFRSAPVPVLLAQDAPSDPATLWVPLPINEDLLGAQFRSATAMLDTSSALSHLQTLRAEQARMWQTLQDFTQDARVDELPRLLERIVLAGAEMTCSRSVWLMLPDDDTGQLRVVESLGTRDDGELTALVSHPVGQVASPSCENVLDDVAGPYCGTEHNEHFVSIPIPLVSQGRQQHRVGLLNLTDRAGDQPFRHWEVEFVNTLANLAGIVLDELMARHPDARLPPEEAA